MAAAVVAALLLMQQPGVATKNAAKWDRLDMAKLKRRKINPDEVRILKLRRAPRDKHETTSPGHEYHHRWIVRGHWRNQYFPSRDGHKPIWIAPHVKGPEDAPLLTGEKVYSWTQ
jgi:hypothetical protein